MKQVLTKEVVPPALTMVVGWCSTSLFCLCPLRSGAWRWPDNVRWTNSSSIRTIERERERERNRKDWVVNNRVIIQ